MTTATSQPVEAEALREIAATRILNAPRSVVWAAWTEPERIAQWWGPTGFTTTIHEMDVRPGGAWRFTMHGPDGVDYRNDIVYEEVNPPERLVYAHTSGPRFRMTATFADQGGKTELAVRMLFETAEQRDQAVARFGAVEGLNQTLGRLAALVAQEGGEA